MQQRFLQQFAVLAVAFAAAVGSAVAASSASSAASDSLSTSVGTSSDSIGKSSDSSSGEKKVADGDYRVERVAAVDARPDRVKLVLTPVARPGDAGFTLELPQQVVDEAVLSTGTVVRAKQKAYGIEFALAETQRVFFRVLEDAVYRELPARPVTL